MFKPIQDQKHMRIKIYDTLVIPASYVIIEHCQ